MDPNSKLMTPDTNNSKMKEKNQNIQVFVRVRPMNSQEKAKHSLTVLDCPGNKEVVVKERTMNNLTKTFTFDKVFGPNSKQIDVYKSVVSPLLEEVLLGYNCTVFAYGQTGTGKTFTMEGDRSLDSGLSWDKDPMSGIVPRALNQLFDELRLQQVEFTVRVSLLELYNEELFDLLAPIEDMKLKTLRLFEDTSRKGSVIIQGLEEVTVHNKHEVYDIMEKGSFRRQTAATLMNEKSSRSHTVFTVTVHIKECNLDGEELLKIGKLNLVDLAGSENIGRSGAVEKRAREAGSINQSLLTLGRVITSLVERTPHVPYRESKLTRLLQDSLGGRTKTSIIATVSPASINLEETLSTLDYAHRAKNITNRPEINQKLTKKAMLKAYTEEIEQLKKDLAATREKNGIFIERGNYDKMMSQLESQGQDISERITQVKSLEENLEKKEEELASTKATLEETQEDLTAANNVISNLKHTLKCTQIELENTKQERDEKGHLVEKHVDTENKLSNEASTLLNTANDTTVNLESLYSKLERKKRVEESNLTTGRRFRVDLTERLQSSIEAINLFRAEHARMSGTQRLELEEFAQNKLQLFEEINASLGSLNEDLQSKTKNLSTAIENQNLETKLWADNASHEMGQYLITVSDHYEKGLLQVFSAVEMIKNTISQLQEGHIKCLDDTLSHYGSLNTRVNEFADDLVSKMDTTFDTIYRYLEDQDRHVGSIDEEALATKTSADIFYDSIKNSVAAIVQQMEHLQNSSESYRMSVEGSKDRLLNETQLMKTERRTFEGVVKSQTEDTKNSASQCMNMNNDKYSEIKKKVSKGKENMLPVFKSSGSLLDEHSNAMSTIVAKGNDFTSKVVGKFELDCKDLTERSSEAKNNFKKEVEDLSCAILSGKIGLEVDAKACFDTDSKLVEFMQTDIKSECEYVSEWSETQVSNVSQQCGILSEYYDSTYLIDLPTGATPQRKVYEYPAILSATSPHDTILSRFRKGRKVSFPSTLESIACSEDEMPPDNIFKTPPADDQMSSSSSSSEDVREKYSVSSNSSETKEKVKIPAYKGYAEYATATPKVFNKENTSVVKSGRVKVASTLKNVDRRDAKVGKTNKKGPTKDVLQMPN